MECNRDEAVRALQFAQSKIKSKEWNIARKFAAKAERLFPSVEASQTSAIISVLTAAERKIQGLPDWYGILQLEKRSEDVFVRRQHRKLALLLHPDKNKIYNSDLAFIIVSEAYNVLSNKEQRFLYDEKLKCAELKESQLKRNASSSDVPLQTENPRNSSNPNGFVRKCQKKHGNASNADKKNDSKNCDRGCSASNVGKKPDSFWTACNHCHMHFEHQRFFNGRFLRCRNCKNAFLAREIKREV